MSYFDENSGNSVRRKLDCIRAAKAASEGMTHRQIATLVGRKPEDIKAMILMGQRLMQLEKLPAR